MEPRKLAGRILGDNMGKLAWMGVGVLIMACVATPDSKINKTIQVSNGETRNEDLSTVNGSVIIGARAKVHGDASTVNGRVEVGKRAEVEDVSSVNGNIAIGEEAEVGEVSVVNGSIEMEREGRAAGEVSTVNGSIRCSAGVKIRGEVSTVNGSIELDNTHVEEDLSTVNGDISLYNATIIQGNLIVDRERRGRWSGKIRPLTIRVDGDSVIKGNIEVKGSDPQVTVVLSNGGKVRGDVINAEVIQK